MLVVETIAKIRRALFVQEKPIKVICRALRVSRKVVRKVIRSAVTEFRYERGLLPLPKIGLWQDRLDAMLLANEVKTPRERLTLIRMFEELRRLGDAGGYDAVRRYARIWRRERGSAKAEACVPLSFAPGEAYQFDWSHEIVVMNGTTVKRTSGSAIAGCCSYGRIRGRRRRWCSTPTHGNATHPQCGRSSSDRRRAFAFFKGTCTRGIYDNMETVFVGKDRQFNRRFLQMCSYYLIEPTACTPSAGWEKGQVENQVGLGPVEIQGSILGLIVIQAMDGPFCTDRRPMGEDGAALPGQANGPGSQRQRQPALCRGGSVGGSYGQSLA
jgi:hypothetical protein